MFRNCPQKMVLIMLGIQTIYSSFLLSILGFDRE